ncbi:Glutamate synthase [NADPH] small chain [Streptomyces sp. RB5]|uniref:Glutamate synthase [NADPH] small chain n=1 Tax=Streptomyces smaragdinus TaxID=2585196 RepID=A0A7K0CN66_9ACTN|nr:glutamate synthase subunit beta [Streptomyces smaragdinus]MQY14928.1 Glutamate synthase [NADPH] small chain [Streptomyces smaragdinus]
MADPKGFLTTARRPRPRRPVGERVDDWLEVYVARAPLPVVSGQAGRCMDCGIPFCHQACPLGNLVPEWNDYVWRDDWEAAAERLHATDNFPEFTGRLCPAPCESGCVLALGDDPVTIRDVERAIADEAWARGLARPRPPGRRSGHKVAVIGSGPAGLAAAQQLTRAGHTVAVYERDDRLGGLLRYGIPAFKLEKHHIDRRIDQMRREGTKFRTCIEVGRHLDATGLRRRYDAVVVAVGAGARRELPVPGRELTGVLQAMDYLPAANRVQEGDYAVPPVSARGLHVVIVGGGDTGADCLGTVVRQGAASVTQLDINPMPGPARPAHQPWPVHPKIHRVEPAYEEAGATTGHGEHGRVYRAATLRFEGDDRGRIRAVHLADAGPGRTPVPGTDRVIPAGLVLLALGFDGPEPDSPLAVQLDLGLAADGTFARDEGYATRHDGVFVAGDAGRGQSLIVWAIAEGRACAAAVDTYLTGADTLPAPVRPADRPLTA